MRKLAREFENPFDNILYDLSEVFSEQFHKWGFTPNVLTTLSNIFFIFSVIYIYKQQYVIATILYIVAYFFDNFDGYFARKYDMVTVFGDYYDHTSDILKGIIIIIILFKLLPSDRFKKFIVIFLILFFIFLVQFGCQEKYYNTNQSPSLAVWKKLCIYNPEKTMRITRYFGSGTLYLLIAYFIATISNNNLIL
jgi:phosphatidylglycerophosphate synthase